MAVAQPTILATSGGQRPHPRLSFALGGLVRYAVELSGASGAPRVCFVGTASGDDVTYGLRMSEAAWHAGLALSHLRLFAMPNVPDVEAHLMAHDVVWVGGGSVANLLAVWRVHGLDDIFRRVWASGVVLAGVSAGSICWFRGGATDSFGPQLRPVTSGLGILPYGNGVHYDSDPGRRPLVHRLVAEGTLPTTYCTDDGVGLLFRGTTLSEVVSEVDGSRGYLVQRDGDRAVEESLTARRLPDPRD